MWSDVISQNGSEAAWPLFLTDLLLKITIVLAAGGALVWLLRRQSAAVKHLVWTLSLISCLLVPVAMLALPGWGVERALAPAPASIQPASAVLAGSANTDLGVAQPDVAPSAVNVVGAHPAHRPTSQDRALPVQSGPTGINSGEQATGNSVPLWKIPPVIRPSAPQCGCSKRRGCCGTSRTVRATSTCRPAPRRRRGNRHSNIC